MKVKLTFDTSVPVDDLPDPIVAEADTLKDAFTEIADRLEALVEFNGPAVESVKILGKDNRDVTDEFNEFWREF